MKKNYDYGCEYAIDGKIIYPAYLAEEDLQSLIGTFRIIFDFFNRDNIEIKVKRSLDEKSIEWQVKIFSYDKGEYTHDNTYTFLLSPNWRILALFHHWYSGSITPRTQEILNPEEVHSNLKDEINEFLNDLSNEYESHKSVPIVNRFLNSEKSRVIYAKCVQSNEIRAEKRVDKFLKAIKKEYSKKGV